MTKSERLLIQAAVKWARSFEKPSKAGKISWDEAYREVRALRLAVRRYLRVKP